MKKILVLDFETDGIDPLTTNPLQFGGIVIDGARLEVIPNSEFNSWCKPDTIDDPDYIKNHQSTLEFHCRNYNITMDELMAKIKNSPQEKLVMENFVEYIKKYHSKQSGQTIFTAPAVAGYNSFNFDFPILDRLCKKYGYVDKDGKQNLYSGRDSMDIMKIAMLWLSPIPDIKSYSMDSVRKYFDMSHTKAHDALFDVQQEAAILIKFLNLHKNLAKNIKFKNCFAKQQEELEHVC